MGKPSIITLPIVMRGNDHEPIKVGNAQVNLTRGVITARISMEIGEGQPFELFGKSVELGLVEGMAFSPLASEFAGLAVAAMDEANEKDGVEVSDL